MYLIKGHVGSLYLEIFNEIKRFYGTFLTIVARKLGLLLPSDTHTRPNSIWNFEFIPHFKIDHVNLTLRLGHIQCTCIARYFLYFPEYVIFFYYRLGHTNATCFVPSCTVVDCPLYATIFLSAMFACGHIRLYRWRPTIRMNEAWRIK